MLNSRMLYLHFLGDIAAAVSSDQVCSQAWCRISFRSDPQHWAKLRVLQRLRHRKAVQFMLIKIDTSLARDSSKWCQAASRCTKRSESQGSGCASVPTPRCGDVWSVHRMLTPYRSDSRETAECPTMSPAMRHARSLPGGLVGIICCSRSVFFHVPRLLKLKFKVQFHHSVPASLQCAPGNVVLTPRRQEVKFWLQLKLNKLQLNYPPLHTSHKSADTRASGRTKIARGHRSWDFNRRGHTGHLRWTHSCRGCQVPYAFCHPLGARPIGHPLTNWFLLTQLAQRRAPRLPSHEVLTCCAAVSRSWPGFQEPMARQQLTVAANLRN